MNDPFNDTRDPLVRTMERRSLEESWANEKRLSARIVQLEAALRRIVLKDGRESIAVTKICDIARRALAGNTLGLEHPLNRKGEPG